MKKYISFVLFFALICISWGGTGHKTVAKIADNHLTPNAKAAVKALLGDQSMSDVASWADQLRNDPQYSNTGSWHYINVPLSLSYEEFSKTVKAQGPANVYGALLKCEDDIKSKTTTYQQKSDALKFIIHFVGDMHQPMHVSRAEDKGGNSIQLQFDGKGTNLHSLWDSGLINKQGETFEQMAIGYDKATSIEIKQWQSTDPMQWAYESYEISTKLYAEADKDKSPGDTYYQQYIPIVQQRIEMAGIRLAGVLNTLFQSFTPPVNEDLTLTAKPITVDSKDVAKHIGDNITTTGKVYSGRVLQSNNMTFLNIGGDNPNQDFTVVIEGDDRSKFGTPEINLKGKTVQITGKVVDYKGKPEIIASSLSQIVVKE